MNGTLTIPKHSWRLFVVLLCMAVLPNLSVRAEEIPADEFAEFIDAVSKTTEGGWLFSYEHESRSLTMRSRAPVKSIDLGGVGGGQVDFSDLPSSPLRIALRLTKKPTKERLERLAIVEARIEECRENMSKGVEGPKGFAYGRPHVHTQLAWKEFLEYFDLQREARDLARPHYTFKSLYFVDNYKNRTLFILAEEQTEEAKQALSDRKAILALLTEL